MTREVDRAEEIKFNALLSSISPGNVYFVTGKNGSGKSRFFGYATKEIRQTKLFYDYGRGRLLCLSGTMYDKYPPKIYRSDKSDGDVVYLGSKVNNNMVSGTAPFRILSDYMLRQTWSPILWRSVSRALNRLNFDPRVRFRFRQRDREVSTAGGELPPELDLELFDAPRDPGLVDRYIGHLASGAIQLADLIFFRNGTACGLSDLSSGEKQYALALLGFIYCGSPGCTVFYDEPENSLHPAWQLTIVKDLADVAHEMDFRATLIIATHSPLIASSVRNGNVHLCDLPSGQAWQPADLYGRASDTVLREQFHLYSARSPEVAAVINKCLAFIAKNETQAREFREVQAELRGFNLDLTPDDPISQIVATIVRV